MAVYLSNITLIQLNNLIYPQVSPRIYLIFRLSGISYSNVAVKKEPPESCPTYDCKFYF